MSSARGALHWSAVGDEPLRVRDLLAEPVALAIGAVPSAQVAAIDAALADTAAFCPAYDVSKEHSANCVVVAGRRGGVTSYAAVIVQATRRADINGAVRRHLDLRKISFAAVDEAVTRTGMEYGGITPIGLPEDWLVLIDTGVVASGDVVVGSGLRRSKLLVAAAELASLPGAVVLPLAQAD